MCFSSVYIQIDLLNGQANVGGKKAFEGHITSASEFLEQFIVLFSIGGNGKEYTILNPYLLVPSNVVAKHQLKM